MAFDKSKDNELWVDTIEGDNDTLRISVFAYNGGERKLQIGPRTYEKKNGDDGFRKAGRLTADEVDFLIEKLPAIREIIKG
jgi:hypothetical protein